MAVMNGMGAKHLQSSMTDTAKIVRSAIMISEIFPR